VNHVIELVNLALVMIVVADAIVEDIETEMTPIALQHQKKNPMSLKYHHVNFEDAAVVEIVMQLHNHLMTELLVNLALVKTVDVVADVIVEDIETETIQTVLQHQRKKSLK